MNNHTKRKVSCLDYCQFLLSSQINYTLTYFADHSEQFRHEAINRYPVRDQIQPRLVRKNVRGQMVTSPQGFLIFDDMVLDKAELQKRIGTPPMERQCQASHLRHRCGDLRLRQSRN